MLSAFVSTFVVLMTDVVVVLRDVCRRRGQAKNRREQRQDCTEHEDG